ncbi:sugar phosphate nucleotidyltransferase [Bacillus sp. FJAT-47783]|uniref:sugar phosphate nucleotidyltransferase n=1 Tax=Bacillus sp. FJAT-47783 TaxID=2922712 RepID=UPI001FAC5071|nr:sugar phosphate nucleotidyltransferase [Bacillus sp. FJAT-47783]
MKAVILAGGKGERLTPLTCHLPKPMVPILNKPLMEYTIGLLKQYGITDIYITLNYLGYVIKDHFGNGKESGVHITYIEEEKPLGTAGGIKLCEQHLNETFLVISGDALTDLHLDEALSFHKSHQQICTVIAKAVNMPLDYGLIIGNPRTKQIEGFIEKPEWNEVCTNLVNTGIYIFEPDIFHFIKREVPTDFSQDIFPQLLKQKIPLHYYETAGYWSDIGSLEQYRQAQFDLLDRKVNLPLHAKEVQKGVWLEKDVYISNRAKYNPPIYIGKNSVISEDCEVKAYTVIGNDSYIHHGSYLERSILWPQQTVMENSQIIGATVGTGCIFEKNSIIFNGAVMGENVHVKREAKVGENVYIWPAKKIPPYSYEKEYVKWGSIENGSLFKARGVQGLSNVECTPEFSLKLALAFGSTINQHSLILVGSDGHPYSKTVAEIMNQSLLCTGVQTMCCAEDLATPIFQYACRHEQVSYGVFIQSDRKGRETSIEFYTNKGVPIDTKLEQAVRKAFQYLNFRRVEGDKIGYEWRKRNVLDSYFSILKKKMDGVSHANYHFAVMNETPVKHHFSKMLQELPCKFTEFSEPITTEQFSSIIQSNNLDGGFWIDRHGERLKIFDQFGHLLDKFRMEGLYLYLSAEVDHKEKIFISPIHDRKKELKTLGTSFSLQYDAFFLFFSFVKTLSKRKEDITSFQIDSNKYHMMYEEVSCHWLKRGEIMRRLIEEFGGIVTSLQNGIKIHHDKDDWTLIFPHAEKPIITILTKASSLQRAKEMTSFYTGKIVHYQKS